MKKIIILALCFTFALPSTAQALSIGQELNSLKVVNWSEVSRYERLNFGSPWLDVDRNGCDTRNDVLKRDLRSTVFETGSKCIISSGTLADPYTGNKLLFTKGKSTSSSVQIDHVISLADAWYHGASNWSAEKRILFANDVDNLLAVDGNENYKKSDNNIAEYQPPNKKFLCKFIAKQIHIKYKYQLSVTYKEKKAFQKIANRCIGS